MTRASLIVAMVVAIASPALATLTGTATYTSSPDGANYDYSLTLKNTGTTPIKTFWFSWIPSLSFLPSVPNSASAPTGWTAQIVQDTYGNSIDFNTAGAGLNPGDSIGGFAFNTVDTPADMAGVDQYFGAYRVGTSYIYGTTVNPNDVLPPSGGIFIANAAPVPEPGVIGLVAGLGALTFIRRRRV